MRLCEIRKELYTNVWKVQEGEEEEDLNWGSNGPPQASFCGNIKTQQAQSHDSLSLSLMQSQLF